MFAAIPLGFPSKRNIYPINEGGFQTREELAQFSVTGCLINTSEPYLIACHL